MAARLDLLGLALDLVSVGVFFTRCQGCESTLDVGLTFVYFFKVNTTFVFPFFFCNYVIGGNERLASVQITEYVHVATMSLYGW